ncbi:MAG: DinB family protein [Vicinamibacterales bacterium]
MSPASDLRAHLLDALDQAYNRRSWHGTNLRGAIRGLTLADLSRRPAAGRHNIWELVVHCAYWKYAVRRRLTGEKRGSFPLAGSNFFPRPEVRTMAAWRRDLALLSAEHRRLRDVVATLPARRFRVRNQGSAFTNLDLIAGVTAHDLYHAGQIQLIKALIRPRR